MRAGYAGGNSVNADGKACYNDYAQLGHTEAMPFVLQTCRAGWRVTWGQVVGLSIPLSDISANQTLRLTLLLHGPS